MGKPKPPQLLGHLLGKARGGFLSAFRHFATGLHVPLGSSFHFPAQCFLGPGSVSQLLLPLLQLPQPGQRRLHTPAILFLQSQNHIQAFFHLCQSFRIQPHLLRPLLRFPCQIPECFHHLLIA